MFETIILNLIFDIVVIVISFRHELWALMVTGISMSLCLAIELYRSIQRAEKIHNDYSVMTEVDLRGKNQEEREKAIKEAIGKILDDNRKGDGNGD